MIEPELSSKTELQQRITQAALKAMLYEVTVNPKPGLVDPVSSGPHLDMDVFDFLASATSLLPYLTACFEAGWSFTGSDFTELFTQIRR